MLHSLLMSRFQYRTHPYLPCWSAVGAQATASTWSTASPPWASGASSSASPRAFWCTCPGAGVRVRCRHRI